MVCSGSIGGIFARKYVLEQRSLLAARCRLGRFLRCTDYPAAQLTHRPTDDHFVDLHGYHMTDGVLGALVALRHDRNDVVHLGRDSRIVHLGQLG